MDPENKESNLPRDNERHDEIMRRRKASYDVRKASATKEKGLIIVHTGPGKGKTSAALGMIFRALGHGMNVGVVQFTKGAIQTGEALFAAELSGRLDFFTLGEGYTWETQNRQRDMEVARRAWQQAQKMVDDPKYQLILLDELNIILKFEYLPVDEVLETLRNKREDLHVIVTGRGAKEELIELADLATEMKIIKHPYPKGIKAQKGIEY
ncbi:cob(I)yrinic acid a,c-diamide adenosyltransferase [bacterium]|nr:cob(I)yrinic acid a,c-diamide adenosyltransferase [bacterium]MCI0602269.1 cob(I)yrinic acid a,c-diamide adenosyltransferase [bacterium]